MTTIRGWRMTSTGAPAPDEENTKLELELECRTHFRAKLRKRRAAKVVTLRPILFSCINTTTFSVLVKAWPLFWSFIGLSHLRLLLSTSEVITLWPLQNRKSDYLTIEERQMPLVHEVNDWPEWQMCNACLYFLLTQDDRAQLSVWLDGLLEKGAVWGGTES